MLQSSSLEEVHRDTAQEITGLVTDNASPLEKSIIVSPLPPLDEAHFDWIRDALPCGPPSPVPFDKLWHTSSLVHLLTLVNAASKVGLNATPPGLRPFALLMCQTTDNAAGRLLEQSFWPGLPDNEWHAWIFAGPHRFNIQGNLGVAECDCGYRYPISECLGPVETRSCGNPEGGCNRLNGGTRHKYASGQKLLAVPIRKGYIWEEVRDSLTGEKTDNYIGPIKQEQPGLFALTEAENFAQISGDNYDAVTEDSVATTVRQLERITFRILHWLVHASALLVAGTKPPGFSDVLQRHIRQVAKIRPVKNQDSVKWYFKACVDADLAAIARLLQGSAGDAACFIHAVLHRLVNESLPDPPAAPDVVLSQAWRSGYETWFQDNIVQPLLEMKTNNPQQLSAITIPKSVDDDCVDPVSYMERKCISEVGWLNDVKTQIRERQLPHILRPVSEPETQDAYLQLEQHRAEELQVRGRWMGGVGWNEMGSERYWGGGLSFVCVLSSFSLFLSLSL